MTVVGVGTIPIKADFGNFHRDVQTQGAKAADGLTSHFSGAFKKIAALGSGILVGAGAVSLLKGAFAEAAEAQKVGKLTEQVIKTTGGAAKITAKQIGDLSTAISQKAGIDDEAIQSGANLVATFTRVRNEAGKGNDIFSQTVQVATDMSVALGQDMKSSSLQLGKALNDPIKGITALSRAGVSFTEDQKKQIKTLQDSGDILGAQKIILKEVGTEFGGAAAAAASPVDKLKVVWGNLLETLGTKGLPIVNKVAGWLSKVLPGALDAAGDAFRRVSDVVGPFFQTLITGDAGLLGTPVEAFALKVRDAFLTVIAAGRKVLDFITGTIVPGIQKGLSELVGGFTGDDKTGFFGGLGAAARTAYDFITGTAIPGIQRVVGSFLDGLQGKGGEGSFFTDLGEAARAAFKIFKDDVLPVIQNVVSWIGDHLKPILIGLAAAFLIVTGPVAILVAGFIFAYQKFQVFRDVVETVIGVVKTVITTAVDVIAWLFSNVLIPAADAVAHFFSDTLWPIIQTVWDAISKAIVWAWQTVIQPVFNFIVAVINNVLIPAFNFIKAIVVDVVFPLVMAIIKDAWEFIQPIFAAIGWVIEHVLVPAFQTISDAVSTVWDLVKPIFEAIIKFVVEKLTPVWEGISAAAAVAFNALPGLIQAALRLAGGIVSSFLGGVAGIADALGLDSIAKVLRSGADSAKGWGQGSTSNDTGKGQGGIFVGGGTRRAMGGPIPGSGRGDHVPILAEPGEFMIRRDSVNKYGRGFMEMINAGRFAKGGLIPGIPDIDLDGIVRKARSLGASALDSVWPKMAVANNFTGIPAGGANYLRDAVIGLIRGSTSSSGGGAGMSGSVADWIRQAMGLTGVPDSWFAPLMARVKLESGGNPNAINKWDINAIRGHPSKGLMQTIDSTFNAYKLPGHGDIWNPVDNASAAIRYILARYGSIFNVNPHTGYALGGLVAHQRSFDSGGVLAPGWNAVRNDTGRAEALSPARNGPLIGAVHLNDREAVDEFWRRTLFETTAHAL